jgi:hypothetical protein
MKDPCNPLSGLTGEVLTERCGGSCKEGAVLPAYAQSNPAVFLSVRLLLQSGITMQLTPMMAFTLFYICKSEPRPTSSLLLFSLEIPKPPISRSADSLFLSTNVHFWFI